MKQVENYYDQSFQQEWERLNSHPMEFAMTKKALDQYLSPNSKILDNGGGPGRYSIYLAEQGHLVTLLDLSNQNVELARTKAQEQKVSIEEFVHGNALELSRFDDETFDAVLVFGTLYHLTEEEDRRKAITESLRVLKPSGMIFVAFISNYAPLLDCLVYYPEEIGSSVKGIRGFLKDGRNIPSEDNPGFTAAYFVNPKEIEPFMKSFGLETLRISGIETHAMVNKSQIQKLSPDQFEQWVDLLYEIGTDSITWGSSEHMLYIGRK